MHLLASDLLSQSADIKITKWQWKRRSEMIHFVCTMQKDKVCSLTCFLCLLASCFSNCPLTVSLIKSLFLFKDLTLNVGSIPKDGSVRHQFSQIKYYCSWNSVKKTFQLRVGEKFIWGIRNKVLHVIQKTAWPLSWCFSGEIPSQGRGRLTNSAAGAGALG